MTEDDLYVAASTEAVRLMEQIRRQTELPENAVSRIVLARALANALVVVAQGYLEENSNEHDLELFFEVNGRQPDDVASWPVNILAGLLLRQTAEGDVQAIFERAVQTAVRYVRSRSSLAWDHDPAVQS